ncbi:MAG: SpoIID/LytB domain-containing protein [Endomicrobium sp.]|nr:SpoIID/LytB domain-containing protein [Endomicrobium sp.]
MKKIFTCAVLALLLCANAYSIDKVQKNVAVGIILDVSSFTTGSSKDFIVSDSSKKQLKFTKGIATVACSSKGVRIDTYDLVLPATIKPSNGVIFANSKPYAGYLKLIKSDQKISIINVLTVEDYVKGVLPKEIISTWAIEALKAQAVISRTYALNNLCRHKRQGFNMCATTHCQVYGGLQDEVHATNQAVQETQGEVLTYDGKFAQTLFHANCGGRTDNPKYLWKWEAPYLKGVKCGYCCKAPHIKWEQEIDANLISKKLANNDIGKIKKIKVKGKTSSGAAKELKIIHSKGKTIVNAYKFRLAVDAQKIKSHVFDSIKTNGDKIYFKGKGWGHKVGLCQWGAKGMAEKGKTYKKILEYFYPGTKMETVIYK